MFCATHSRKPEGKVNKISVAHPLRLFSLQAHLLNLDLFPTTPLQPSGSSLLGDSG